VKLDKVAKQLRRDLLANPKKAAALGLMLLVAAYFWAPLAWRWLSPPGKKTAKGTDTNLILTDDPVEPNAKAKGSAIAVFRWEKVRELMDADPRMLTALLDADWRDPFIPPPPVDTSDPEESAAQTEAQRAAAPPPAELGPQEAGLKLASVAILPRGRSAIVNGETYREGQTIVAAGKDKTAALEFVIVRIERRGVELERNGKTWQLGFDQPKLAQGDGIEWTGSNKPE
jgi:hypothetical protein